jgi:16S rRNA G966 N2-methylase RsmD
VEEAYERTLSALPESAVVKPSTFVIAEHDRKFDPRDEFGSLARFRKLEQGDAALSFYRLKL